MTFDPSSFPKCYVHLSRWAHQISLFMELPVQWVNDRVISDTTQVMWKWLDLEKTARQEIRDLETQKHKGQEEIWIGGSWVSECVHLTLVNSIPTVNLLLGLSYLKLNWSQTSSTIEMKWIRFNVRRQNNNKDNKGKWFFNGILKLWNCMSCLCPFFYICVLTTFIQVSTETGTCWSVKGISKQWKSETA